jgi:3-deoxy-7-phosphoheptulonate synthase
VKVGPGTTPDRLLVLLSMLNPDEQAGKIVLIHRFGAHAIAKSLPQLVDAVQAAKRRVLWTCDPMHGNTDLVRIASGPHAGTQVKTRKFDHILAEVEQAFEIHRMKGSVLGGVHFELTGEEVTECTGGARGLSDEGLMAAYRSRVDPRLNYEQALEMALRIARRLGG